MTTTDEEQTAVWKTLEDNNSDFKASISAILAAELAAAAAARLAPADFVATFAPAYAAKIAADPVLAADRAFDANAFAIQSLGSIPSQHARNAADAIAASIAGTAAAGTAVGDVLGVPYFARIAEAVIRKEAESDWRGSVEKHMLGKSDDAGLVVYSAYANAISPAIAAAAPAIAAKIAGIAAAQWNVVINRTGIARP